MTDPRTHMQRLRQEAKALPDGPAKVAVLEEAVRLADCHRDGEWAYQLRRDLFAAGTDSGRPDVSLAAFAWCLAQFDRQPGRFDRDELLWGFKGIIGDAASFPEVSRRQLEDMLADMERRYRQAGSTMHAYHETCRDFYLQIGDLPNARRAQARLRRSRCDTHSSCAACLAGGDVWYYSDRRHWRRAAEAAQPVLAGQLTCHFQPHGTLTNVLLPLLHLGRVDEARVYQKRGYRLICQDTSCVSLHAYQLRFLVLVGDLAQAKRLLERHLPAALTTVVLDRRLVFLFAAALWTERLLAQGICQVKVRLPAGPPPPAANGKSDVQALKQWFTDEARVLARRFDARNGNNSYERELDELPHLLRLAVE